MFRFVFIAAAVLTLAGIVTPPPARAETLDAPTGPVVLTVSGAITNTNGDGVARFDLEMLRALATSKIVTETIWTPATHLFEGTPLATLMEAVGATGDTVAAMAINDYSVNIPLSDAKDGAPIIAFEMDGKAMSRRDKGPLWLIYPYSSDPAFRTEVIYARSIWQMDRMTVQE